MLVSEEPGENKHMFIMYTLSYLTLPQENRPWINRWYILTTVRVICPTWQMHSMLGKSDQDELAKMAMQKQ